jgi:hypothetical protein
MRFRLDRREFPSGMIAATRDRTFFNFALVALAVTTAKYPHRRIFLYFYSEIPSE